MVVMGGVQDDDSDMALSVAKILYGLAATANDKSKGVSNTIQSSVTDTHFPYKVRNMVNALLMEFGRKKN